MNEAKKESPSQFQVVVEVDGNPVGYLSIDLDRLWPLINFRSRASAPVEWIDPERFGSVVRAGVLQRFMNGLQARLHAALGDKMVKAEMDIEHFTLKAEAAAQEFGRTEKEVAAFVTESGRTTADFYNFFWDFLLDERDVVDPKKEWERSGR